MADALREIAGDIDRERCVKFAHHGKRVIAIVAISVVEGETGEAPREVAFGQPSMQLVYGDDIDVARAKMRQRRAQEIRRHLRMTIGLEFVRARRADVMQHENRADAGEDRAKQMMRAGEVERSQSGADDAVA